MRIVKREIGSGDAKCGCCGRAHRVMHLMDSGMVMGSTCAETVTRVSGGDGFNGKQATTYLRMCKPNSPALRFAVAA